MALGTLRSQQTVVGRLRARAPAAEPVSARLRLSHQLASVEGRPAGLPPAAVLVVRELRDPAPGVLTADRLALAAPVRWEQELRRALDRALAGAARPARELVPAESAAVVFADPSELLACLLRDLRRGAVLDRWWWRTLVGRRAPHEATAELAFEHAAWLPGALALLAAHDRAATLAPLGEPALRRLAAAVRGRHPPTPASPPAPSARSAASRSAASRSASRPDPSPAAGRRESEREHDGSRDSAYEAAAELVALCARVDPRRARARARARPAPRRSAPPGTETGPARQVADTSGPLPTRRGVPRAQASPAPTAPVAGSRSPASSSPTPRAGHVELPGPAGSRVRAGDPDAPSTVPRRPPSRPLPIAEAPVPLEEVPPVLRDDARVVSSRVAGVLHLLNVALDLGLYADFTRPRDRGLPLHPFDFVALLARRLLPRRATARDPLFALLAELAGRDPASPPGAGVDPGAGAVGRTVAQRRARLADALAVRVGERLALALDEADRRRAAILALQRAGTVHAAAARVDVHFALADLPPAVRLSGLDRDPGWIPAAGYHVAYHFA